MRDLLPQGKQYAIRITDGQMPSIRHIDDVAVFMLSAGSYNGDGALTNSRKLGFVESFVVLDSRGDSFALIYDPASITIKWLGNRVFHFIPR